MPSATSAPPPAAERATTASPTTMWTQDIPALLAQPPSLIAHIAIPTPPTSTARGALRPTTLILSPLVHSALLVRLTAPTVIPEELAASGASIA